MALHKPLLMEGPAGVGKTEFAKVLACVLQTRLVRLKCYEGLDVHSAPKEAFRIALPLIYCSNPLEQSVFDREYQLFFHVRWQQPLSETDDAKHRERSENGNAGGRSGEKVRIQDGNMGGGEGNSAAGEKIIANASYEQGTVNGRAVFVSSGRPKRSRSASWGKCWPQMVTPADFCGRKAGFIRTPTVDRKGEGGGGRWDRWLAP